MGGKPFRSGFQRLGSHRHCGPGGLRSLLRLPFEAHRGNPLSQSRTAENRRTGLLRRRIATADGIDRSFRLGFPGCHASGCYCTRPPVHAGAQVVPRGAGPSTAAGFGRIAGRRRRLPEPTRAAFGDESPSPHLATSSRNRKPVILPSGGEWRSIWTFKLSAVGAFYACMPRPNVFRFRKGPCDTVRVAAAFKEHLNKGSCGSSRWPHWRATSVVRVIRAPNVRQGFSLLSDDGGGLRDGLGWRSPFPRWRNSRARIAPWCGRCETLRRACR